MKKVLLVLILFGIGFAFAEETENYEEALENGIQNALVPLLNDEKEEA